MKRLLLPVLLPVLFLLFLALPAWAADPVLELSKNEDGRRLDMRGFWDALWDEPCPERFAFFPSGHFAVTAEQVQAMAQKYCDASKQLTLVLTGKALDVCDKDKQKLIPETFLSKGKSNIVLLRSRAIGHSTFHLIKRQKLQSARRIEYMYVCLTTGLRSKNEQ